MGCRVGFLTKIIIAAMFCGAVTVEACGGCDARLVEGYGDFVDTVVEVREKVRSGDRAVVAQMKELAVEAEEWAKQLGAYAAYFTQEQSLRVADLKKMAAEALGVKQ